MRPHRLLQESLPFLSLMISEARIAPKEPFVPIEVHATAQAYCPDGSPLVTASLGELSTFCMHSISDVTAIAVPYCW